MRKDEAKELIMAMLECSEEDYQALYFDLGSRWQESRAQGWPLWGCIIWEGWWQVVWDKYAARFIESLKMDEDGNVYILFRSTGKTYKKETLWYGFEKFMATRLPYCQANQAVMEMIISTVKR